MSGSAAGAVAGMSLGLAGLLLWSWRRARRPLRMIDRIGPFIGVPGLAATGVTDPTIGPARLRELAAGLSTRAPRDGLPTLLRRAGADSGPSDHRLNRLAWSGVGIGVGWAVGSALMASGSPAAIAVVLAGTGGVAGWWACDLRLRHRARERQRRLEAQLPLLADLVALVVTAGGSPLVALESAAATMGGPVADEVGRASTEVHAGASVDGALRDLADATGLPAAHRLVDSLLMAVELGTPLAEVARAQAADIRSDERRRLMESAGRRDVAMLVPIVFLVLPSVVLVALYPGLQSLRLVVT